MFCKVLLLLFLASFLPCGICHYDLSGLVDRVTKLENEKSGVDKSLNSLKSEVTQLKTEMAKLKQSRGKCVLEDMMQRITKLEDECPVEDSTLSSKNCADGTRWINKTALLLNADHGVKGKNEWCHVLIGGLPETTGRYEVTVKLNNIKGSGGVNYGHPGVMYNAQDLDNFDFVYFRPHSASTCYQTAHAVNGQFSFTSTGPCPDGPPRGTFLVRLLVHSNSNVQIFKNNKLVTTVDPHFDVAAKGGIMVANGHQNVIEASDFIIKKL